MSNTHASAAGRSTFPNRAMLRAGLSLLAAMGGHISMAHAAAAAAADEGLQEIVVTARRRPENLQQTPLSVSVLSGTDAVRRNVRNFQDLRGFVPGLEVTPVAGGSAFNLTIRGIGQPNIQANVDNKVGFYLDGLYIARSDGNALSFYDVASLQVLKGPQGTLFGKNTLGGAILLDTQRPVDAFGGYLDVRAGNYRRLDVEGALNVPVSDKVLTRFSFRTQNARGYITHLLDSKTSNGQDDRSARLQVQLLPTDRLTIDLLGEYNHSDTDGEANITVACNPNSNYQRNYDSLHATPFCASYPVLGKKYQVYGGATLSIPTSSLITVAPPGVNGVGALANQNGLTLGGHSGPFSQVRVSTGNVRLNYVLSDNLTLKSITGYRHSSNNSYRPTVDVPNDLYSELDRTSTDQFSQELTLSGNYLDGDLNFVTGLYYIKQKTKFAQDTGPDWVDPIGYSYFARNNFESAAAFIQGTYKITPKLWLTLGGRYNYDHKIADSSVYAQRVFIGNCATFALAFNTGGACGGTVSGAGTEHWTAFDPRAQLQYQFTKDLMGYVSVTGGYSSGGYNQQLGANLGGGLISYDPERVWNYEAGIKSEWFDNRLRLNLSAFHQSYSNYQATVIVVYNGVTSRAIQNAAKAHEDGVELEVQAQPTSRLTLRGSAAYLAQGFDQIGAGVSAFTLGSPVGTAPKYQASLAADYRVPLSSGAAIIASLDYRWLGKKPVCAPPTNGCTRISVTPSYDVLGGRLTYSSPDERWSIGLWGTNLLNQYYYLSYTAGLDAVTGATNVTPGRPREFGIQARHSF